MNCKTVMLAFFCVLATVAKAEGSQTVVRADRNLFNHLDLGVDAGTTGLGLNLATPITDWCRVRAGFSYMPQFNVPLTFQIDAYAEDNGMMGTGERFQHMKDLLKSFTGIQMNDEVDMNSKCTMLDFNLLFDIYPLKNDRRWRATVGFFWGRSRIGHSENSIKDMPSLVSLTIYNQLYDYFTKERYWREPLMGQYLDPAVGDAMRDKFNGYGRLGVHLGEFKQGVTIDGRDVSGQPFMMEPDEEDKMVKADMFVNYFKPYVGLGFDTKLSKDGRWKLGVDAGVLLWGGSPNLLTHPNYNYNGATVDLIDDVKNIGGKVGDYVDIARVFKVYPKLSVNFSYRIF